MQKLLNNQRFFGRNAGHLFTYAKNTGKINELISIRGDLFLFIILTLKRMQGIMKKLYYWCFLDLPFLPLPPPPERTECVIYWVIWGAFLGQKYIKKNSVFAKFAKWIGGKFASFGKGNWGVGTKCAGVPLPSGIVSRLKPLFFLATDIFFLQFCRVLVCFCKVVIRDSLLKSPTSNAFLNAAIFSNSSVLMLMPSASYIIKTIRPDRIIHIAL